MALARVFGGGVRPLHLEQAVFEAMLEGWRRQQLARFFKPKTIRSNLQAARAFREHADCWPWQWRPEHADEFFSDLVCEPNRRRPATLRSYQLRLKGLPVYLTDPRYPWMAICRREFEQVPVELGPATSGRVAITKGLSEGDQIALADLESGAY